jgi:hypothetical protein
VKALVTDHSKLDPPRSNHQAPDVLKRSGRVLGGPVGGDHAVVLFDGNSKLFDALHGEVILRRDGGAWLVADELVQIGSADAPAPQPAVTGFGLRCGIVVGASPLR